MPHVTTLSLLFIDNRTTNLRNSQASYLYLLHEEPYNDFTKQTKTIVFNNIIKTIANFIRCQTCAIHLEGVAKLRAFEEPKAAQICACGTQKQNSHVWFTKSKAAEALVFLSFTVGLSTGLWHEINMSRTCMHVQIVRSLGV